MNSIVLGAGCFWCIEAVYKLVNGVTSVTSGYAGGDSQNPNYYSHADHAEVIELKYDSSIICLENILEIFFGSHDPTTLNRQGYDMGEEYRSIILCSAEEVVIAEKAVITAQKLWDNPIVTEIKVLKKFYIAEKQHQNFYENNSTIPYCQVIINPKLENARRNFTKYLRK